MGSANPPGPQEPGLGACVTVKVAELSVCYSLLVTEES